MQFVVVTHEAAELEFREQAEQYWAAWRAYGQALSEADVLVGLGALAPQGTNPKGLPGGYFILDVADLDEAVQWASRCAAATNGTVEVRPVLAER